MRIPLAVLLLSGCQHSEPIASCADNLQGVYVAPTGQRWMLLDNGGTLEVFPLFDDAAPGGAPRVIDFRRGDKVTGAVKRRFVQRDVACEARAPATITSCGASGLQLVLADVSPPLGYSPCEWPSSQPSRVELWRRE